MFKRVLMGLLILGTVQAGAQVERINGTGVLPPDLPFSEAVKVGNTLYLSGQIGVVNGTFELAKGGIEAETHQVMRNMRTVLATQGLSLSDLVKCTVMLADIAEWPKFNSIYATYFKQGFPARSAFGADGLAGGARVEVECIAAYE